MCNGTRSCVLWEVAHLPNTQEYLFCKQFWVVLENSNVEKLASNQYLLVQSRSKEDRYDINDASAAEVYPILVPESTMSML